ncbi:hypothetical protein [Streptomyces nanshensis]|nr:hypothetical protein [Streptomyces nanshensis]
MSRHLRLIAAVAVVLVALSGFSPGRKGGGRSHSHSSGGGCSSSSTSSHNSHSGSGSYDGTSDDRSYGSGDGYRNSRRYNHTTGTTTGSRNGTTDASPSGTVTRCAAQSGSEAKAVVDVRNPNRVGKSYRVTVVFLDASGATVDSGTAEVRVGSRATQSVDVRMAHPKRIGDVTECRVQSVS